MLLSEPKKNELPSNFVFLKAKERENIALNDLHVEVKPTFKGRIRYQKVAKRKRMLRQLAWTHTVINPLNEESRQTPQTEQQ